MALCLNACRHKQGSISFYYWKTRFDPDSIELQAIRDNGVKKLYLRYFDVDFVPGTEFPSPVAPVIRVARCSFTTIIPVIFIRNRTFANLDSMQIQLFTRKLFELVTRINNDLGNQSKQIQFDCDWTEKTRESYFQFLRVYHAISPDTISCTIRLHQIKYRSVTGVPPVQRAVLMLYNMGNISAAAERSVYEPGLAEKYLPSLPGYPIVLDLALPIFSWGLQIRDNRVVQLLNKMKDADVKNDTNFIQVKEHWYEAKNACFRAGYYYRLGDRLKIEQLSEKEILDMSGLAKKYAVRPFETVIFFDLDQSNLEQYDKAIFKKALARVDF